jgi:hypothetical protein
MSRSAPAPQNTYDPDVAAAAGAAFLDGKRLSCTTNWRRYIDAARLDMGNHRRDIKGQLRTNDETLGITEAEAVALGFEPAVDDRDHAFALTLAWLQILTADENQAVA